MRQAVEPDSFFKAGMYLLDSFTSGMYNDPLTIYREYVQNAVDSIDVTQPHCADGLEVRINLEPHLRRITIIDNAMGIPASVAEEMLSTIGNSNKAESRLRGFRGIGRLGGIAFADKAVFRTKAVNEPCESIQTWDCRNLRDLLLKHRKQSLTLEEVFRRITTFGQEKCEKTRESYFEVTLEGVTSFRNQLFDIQKVRRYLSQIAPVPLNPLGFSYAPIIDDYLSSRLSHYGRYNLILNGEKIFKPYRDRLKVTKKGEADFINGIEFFEIKNGQERPMALGWYGKRKDLLGSITRGDDSAGIRVRVGNIQVGDAHLLDFCFREPRFNSYVPGEIYVECADLIPNSRRDDFVDNLTKGLFYNAIEREVGIPVSKEIRLRSRLASSGQSSSNSQAVDLAQIEHPGREMEPSKMLSLILLSEDEQKERANGDHSVSPNVPSESAVFQKVFLDQAAFESALNALKDVCNKCPNFSKLIEALEINVSGLSQPKN